MDDLVSQLCVLAVALVLGAVGHALSPAPPAGNLGAVYRATECDIWQKWDLVHGGQGEQGSATLPGAVRRHMARSIDLLSSDMLSVSPDLGRAYTDRAAAEYLVYRFRSPRGGYPSYCG